VSDVAKRGVETLSGEDRLIARHFKPLARDPGALGLLDDAAVLRPPRGYELVLTVDAIIAGVHFFPDDPPDTVARKALRVNLSDLAAKGAAPAGFLLMLALPGKIGDNWLKPFAHALGSDATRYGCPLLGGDTVATPGPLTISITAFGTLPVGSMVLRSGARAGDHVIVTGTVGDAALGLKLRTDPFAVRRWGLNARERRDLIRRYQLPEPRNALAEAVREHASAAMDVSDGLAGDLAKLCRASSVAAEIEAGLVPLSGGARTAVAAERKVLPMLLSGGDDYEIVASVAPERFVAFEAAAKAARVPVSRIGRVMGGRGVRFLGPGGKALTFAKASFSHF
jgi:thiamine-monophosphate kinase